MSTCSFYFVQLFTMCYFNTMMKNKAYPIFQAPFLARAIFMALFLWALNAQAQGDDGFSVNKALKLEVEVVKLSNDSLKVILDVTKLPVQYFQDDDLIIPIEKCRELRIGSNALAIGLKALSLRKKITSLMQEAQREAELAYENSEYSNANRYIFWYKRLGAQYNYLEMLHFLMRDLGDCEVQGWNLKQNVLSLADSIASIYTFLTPP